MLALPSPWPGAWLDPDPPIRLGWAAEAAGSEQPSGSQGPEILRIAAKIARRHSKVKLIKKHWFFAMFELAMPSGRPGAAKCDAGHEKTSVPKLK